MKSKKGYGMKKSGSIKVAGGPSFEIRPTEHDPSASPADEAYAKRTWERFVNTVPNVMEIRRKGQAYKQRMKGV